MARFVSIWFPHLKTDWFELRQIALQNKPFVLTTPDHGRLVITACNQLALNEGIYVGMALADARAIQPALEVRDDRADLTQKLLKGIAEWCIRYTPSAAIDLPDGLILDATGCPHLWGGETLYLAEISRRLKGFGYKCRLAIADTIGAAWAICRYDASCQVVASGHQLNAVLPLPVTALRLPSDIVIKLQKLGMWKIQDVIDLPRVALRRRFGEIMLSMLDKALGNEIEFIQPVIAPEPYQERLPCMDPIVSAAGIEIAIKKLLDNLCKRLQQEAKGLRQAVLSCYRVDGKLMEISIGTNKSNANPVHLFKLFENKIGDIQPDLGIELFVLLASKVEDHQPTQETMFSKSKGIDNQEVAELLDRIAIKHGSSCIERYLPAEHYWPERSCKATTDIAEQPTTTWNQGRPRPLVLLPKPETILVTAPIPDYPPMMFRYKGVLHKVNRADGPERIEQEWWLQDGQHRDYYIVEDEAGHRYWIFRSGHYDAEKTHGWFLHGFFA